MINTLFRNVDPGCLPTLFPAPVQQRYNLLKSLYTVLYHLNRALFLFDEKPWFSVQKLVFLLVNM